MSQVKKQMQQLIVDEYRTGNIDNISEAIEIYENSQGKDDFSKMVEETINNELPLIAIVCDKESEDRCGIFLEEQVYLNYSKIIVCDDYLSEIVNYLADMNFEYVLFYDCNSQYDDLFLYKMASTAVESKCDIVISLREYYDRESKCIISHCKKSITEKLFSGIFAGEDILRASNDIEENLYGNIGNALISCRSMNNINIDVDIKLETKIYRTFYEKILRSNNVIFCNKILVNKVVFCDEINHTEEYDERKRTKIEVDKKITFYYTSKGEYYNLLPIAEEAKRRGYHTEFTENLREKAEIGIYCQHVCYPENSKFSVVLLHDMAQGHNRWPNLWELEPWHGFDIGILPGEFWASLWKKSAFMPYTNPKCGCFAMGYPKSDECEALMDEDKINNVKAKMGLKYEKTILYAPSWEFAEKEDDFVKALASLPVNLIIKQAKWSEAYAQVNRWIEDMRSLHEGRYSNLFYFEQTDSIMDAIAVCDLIISDESSVMTEGLLMKKPSIAVYDWLIPDTTPARYSSTPFDYVIKCKKVELREYVEKFIAGDPIFENTMKEGEHFYNNIGNCSKDIMDCIEYYCGFGKEDEFLKWKLENPWPKNYIFDN